MLTVKPVYKLKNVSDDLKWTTDTHVTPFTLTSKSIPIVLEHVFAPSFCYHTHYPTPSVSNTLSVQHMQCSTHSVFNTLGIQHP